MSTDCVLSVNRMRPASGVADMLNTTSPIFGIVAANDCSDTPAAVLETTYADPSPSHSSEVDR